MQCPYPSKAAHSFDPPPGPFREYRCPVCREATLGCPACGAANRLLGRHCPNCGRPLPDAGHATVHGRPDDPFCAQQDPIRVELSRGWSVRLDDKPILYLLAAGGCVVAVSFEGRYWLLDELDGKVHYRDETRGPIVSAPLIVDDLLFLASEREILALDLLALLYKTSGQHWEVKHVGPLRAVGVCPERALVLTLAQDAERGDLLLYFLPPRSREDARHYRSELAGEPLPLIATTRDLALVASRQGQLLLVGLDDGKPRGRHQIAAGVGWIARASEDRFIVADQEGHLFNVALDGEKPFCVPLDVDTSPRIHAAVSNKYVTVCVRGEEVSRLKPMGRESTRRLMGNRVTQPPLLRGRVAILVADDGMAYGLFALHAEPELQQLIRLWEPGDALAAVPVATQNSVLVATTQGCVNRYRVSPAEKR